MRNGVSHHFHVEKWRNGVSHHFHEPPYRGGRLNVSFAKPWNWLGEIGEKHAGSAVQKSSEIPNLKMWT